MKHIFVQQKESIHLHFMQSYTSYHTLFYIRINVQRYFIIF